MAIVKQKRKKFYSLNRTLQVHIFYHNKKHPILCDVFLMKPARYIWEIQESGNNEMSFSGNILQLYSSRRARSSHSWGV